MIKDDILGVNIENIELSDIPEGAVKISMDSFPDINNIAGAVLKEFREVNQFNGVVRMSYKKGIGTTLQKAKAGGYTGNIIDEKGKIVGHVNLDDVSKTAAVAGSAMQILSIITSQYYLHEINKSLNKIQSKVDNIGRLLEIDKRSHLKAREHYIHDLLNNIIDIQGNAIEINAVLTQVQQLEIEAYSDYITIAELINGIIDSIDIAKKQGDILELITKIKNYIPQLWCALYLYASSKYLRMIFSGTIDKNRIDNLYNEISNMILEYKNRIEEYYVKSFDLVNEHDAFKVNEMFVDTVKTIGGTGGLPGLLIKNKAIDEVKGMVQDRKNTKKTKTIGELFDAFYYTCKDTEPIKKICDDIRFYNILNNEPVELILDEEDIYIIHNKVDGAVG